VPPGAVGREVVSGPERLKETAERSKGNDAEIWGRVGHAEKRLGARSVHRTPVRSGGDRLGRRQAPSRSGRVISPAYPS